MIAQAAAERTRNLSNAQELELFDQYFQNWGTPEGHRIRPHFTMLYNYTKSKADLEAAFATDEHLSTLLANLRQITFTRLAIVQIDFWGNPIKGSIIAEFSLQG